MSRSRVVSRAVVETKQSAGLKWRAFLFSLIIFVSIEVGVVMYAGLNTTTHFFTTPPSAGKTHETVTNLRRNLGLDSFLVSDQNISANWSIYEEYIDKNDSISPEGFGILYTEMCEKFFIPRTIKADDSFRHVFVKIVDKYDIRENGSNVYSVDGNNSQIVTIRSQDSSLPDETNRPLPVCSCVPKGLVGQLNVTFNVPYLGALELSHPEIHSGGSWRPRDCLARHRTAIIIPFRDREEHLTILLNYLHPLLQHQKLYYRIFVIEQVYPAVFNKASVMNAGYREATRADSFDCFIFHDVDMIPENDYNFYTCTPQPRHVGSHCDKFHYQVPYPNIFGGVTAFTSAQFQKANGFSNEYYGWGGEDDDMFQRIRASDMNISRFPGNIARYTMIKHGSDAGNPYNSKSYVAWSSRPKHYKKDGLNTLRFYRRTMEERPLYTWILIELPDARPIENTRTTRSQSSSTQHVPCFGRLGSIVVYSVLFIIWQSNYIGFG